MRSRSRKRYSIARLLSRQPKSLQKDPRYEELLHHFELSDLLKRIRISSRCYRILDAASLAPENLESFYRTYRLIKDPFFPLFLAIKRNYLTAGAKRKRAKEEWIRKEMEKIPSHFRAATGIIAEQEASVNSIGAHPVWDAICMPRTKKRVKELIAWGVPEWKELIERYILAYRQKYRARRFSAVMFSAAQIDAMLACCVLELPYRRNKPPSATALQRQFRALSKKYHPDAGGDPQAFRLLKWAKDLLRDS